MYEKLFDQRSAELDSDQKNEPCSFGKSGLEHPAKSKPVTHFGMQVYKKEVFQYEHFQSFGIFIFLGKQNSEACDTKPRKKVEQLLKY